MGEANYQRAKKDGKLISLSEEPSIKDWTYWRLIKNRFPYDMVMRDHDMLIPKRGAANLFEITADEMAELSAILKDFVEGTYDLWFVNTDRQRSIKGLFHIHLANYVDSRDNINISGG